MSKTELPIRSTRDADSLAGSIERVCGSFDLACTLKCELTTYPGSVHWHFQLESQPGTLEITLWPRGNKAWISYRSNRTGPRIGAKIPAVTKALRAALAE
jgi:hypothetical protein